jgi:hypothetical protein
MAANIRRKPYNPSRIFGQPVALQKSAGITAVIAPADGRPVSAHERRKRVVFEVFILREKPSVVDRFALSNAQRVRDSKVHFAMRDKQVDLGRRYSSLGGRSNFTWRARKVSIPRDRGRIDRRFVVAASHAPHGHSPFIFHRPGLDLSSGWPSSVTHVRSGASELVAT